MRDKVLQYIRERGLMRAGDRVGVAVSGGADSVALLRVLLELKAELGMVLSAVHFNHQLRAEQSDGDEAFVAELAKETGLELFVGHGDVRRHASVSKLSIEAAARELRYRWFADIAREQRLNAVATAHTLDDQAETVLLKLIRGAGTRGLGGIYPAMQLAVLDDRSSRLDAGAADMLEIQSPAEADSDFESESPDAGLKASSTRACSTLRVVRPLLGVTRQVVEDYLTILGQVWREDESNLDRRFRRNRVRHDLLPLLEREFNPNIRQVLGDLAEVSRGEEEYWRERVDGELARRCGEADETEGAGKFRLDGFVDLPKALQRRLLRGFAKRQGVSLEFEHVETLRGCALGERSKVELPGGRIAVKQGTLLAFCLTKPPSPGSYRYPLPIPGEVYIPELEVTLRAQLVAAEFAREASPGEMLSLDLVAPELIVRNWCHGDRFWPAHSRSEEKLKRLFAEKRIAATERPSWPVVLSGNEIVWVRGFPVAQTHRWTGTGLAVRIEAVPLTTNE